MNPIAQSRMWGDERYDGKIMSDLKIFNYMDPDFDCLIFDPEVVNIIYICSNNIISLVCRCVGRWYST